MKKLQTVRFPFLEAGMTFGRSTIPPSKTSFQIRGTVCRILQIVRGTTFLPAIVRGPCPTIASPGRRKRKPERLWSQPPRQQLLDFFLPPNNCRAAQGSLRANCRRGKAGVRDGNGGWRRQRKARRRWLCFPKAARDIFLQRPPVPPGCAQKSVVRSVGERLFLRVSPSCAAAPARLQG